MERGFSKMNIIKDERRNKSENKNFESNEHLFYSNTKRNYKDKTKKNQECFTRI